MILRFLLAPRRFAACAASVIAVSVLAGAAHAGTVTYPFTFSEANACADPTFYNNSDQCWNYRNGETGSGTLSFDSTNITGVGNETILLSQLTNATFNFSLTLIPNDFGLLFTQSGVNSPVTFDFSNGLLTGIGLTAVCNVCSDTLALTGDFTGTSYIHRDGGNSYYYGPWTGQKTIDQEGNLTFGSRSGTPPGAPEPSTMLLVFGSLVALVTRHSAGQSMLAKLAALRS